LTVAGWGNADGVDVQILTIHKNPTRTVSDYGTDDYKTPLTNAHKDISGAISGDGIILRVAVDYWYQKAFISGVTVTGLNGFSTNLDLAGTFFETTILPEGWQVKPAQFRSRKVYQTIFNSRSLVPNGDHTFVATATYSLVAPATPQELATDSAIVSTNNYFGQEYDQNSVTTGMVNCLGYALGYNNKYIDINGVEQPWPHRAGFPTNQQPGDLVVSAFWKVRWYQSPIDGKWYSTIYLDIDALEEYRDNGIPDDAGYDVQQLKNYIDAYIATYNNTIGDDRTAQMTLIGTQMDMHVTGRSFNKIIEAPGTFTAIKDIPLNPGQSLVVLVAEPYSGDYHWYKLDADGGLVT